MNLLAGREEIRPGESLDGSGVEVGDAGDVEFVSKMLLDVLSEMLSQLGSRKQVG